MRTGVVSDIDGSVIYSACGDAGTYSVVDEVARRALFTGRECWVRGGKNCRIERS